MKKVWIVDWAEGIEVFADKEKAEDFREAVIWDMEMCGSRGRARIREREIRD